MPMERRKKDLLFWTDKEQLKENVADLNKLKSLGPDGFYPRLLKELIKQISELLPVVFEKWGIGEIPEE